VEALLARYETDQNEELDTLAAYYEKMKPKDAARVFDVLDLPYLIQIVGRMKEAKVADIIGKMDTLRAKTLTMELARRRDPSVLVEETAVR
jgi:flagellar motility protein MotE (MotC chaperone)